MTKLTESQIYYLKVVLSKIEPKELEGDGSAFKKLRMRRKIIEKLTKEEFEELLGKYAELKNKYRNLYKMDSKGLDEEEKNKLMGQLNKEMVEEMEDWRIEIRTFADGAELAYSDKEVEIELTAKEKDFALKNFEKFAPEFIPYDDELLIGISDGIKEA